MPSRSLYSPLTCLLVLVSFAGCNQDEIRTYDVPPLPSVADSVDSSENELPNESEVLSDPTHRMLGAIVPGGSQAWFFKLVGTTDQAAELQPAFESLLASLAIDDATGQPTWSTPDGWQQKPASGMRLATLSASTSSGDVELSVIGLAKGADWNQQLLDNLNRWRGQMKLSSIGIAQLPKETKPIESVDDAVLIDIQGIYSGGMSPAAPFAGGGQSPARPPFASPPAAVPATRPAVAAEKITYETPKGWVPGKQSSMRVASLLTSEEPTAAEARISKWPNAGAMGDALMNVNRWRGQVGLAQVDAAGLAESAQPFSVDGADGSYYEMVGENRAQLAVMSTRGNLVWFFILTGTPDVVEQQRETFRTWVASASFSSPAVSPTEGE